MSTVRFEPPWDILLNHIYGNQVDETRKRRTYNMWIKRKDYDKMVVRIEFLENQLCPNGVHDFKEIDSYLTGGTGNGDEQRITICKCTKCGKIKEI
jgi:hypothetical protein